MNMRERLAVRLLSLYIQNDGPLDGLTEADAVLDELMTPTEGMLTEGVLAYELIGIAGGIINTAEDHLELILKSMIKAAKEGK